MIERTRPGWRNWQTQRTQNPPEATKASQPERLFHAQKVLVPVLVPVGTQFANLD
jgi:hypothetical protein